MGKKSRSTKTTPVETVRHKDKRANIPTEELRDFVSKEEEAPFHRPQTGKLAVKVINHYGDEVLKVFNV